MKYLKKFNESSVFGIKNIDDDVIQTIKDILLPISDMGYEISIIEDDKEGFTQLVIRVVEWRNEPLLITNEVKEDFIRMKDYLESEGFDSIKAYYITLSPYPLKRGTEKRKIEEFDDFINHSFDFEKSINNLLFVAKHSYL